MAFEDTVRAVLDHKGVGVCFVAPQTPVFDALSIMSQQDIGAVLVVNDGALEGVMSERDYARKVILEGKSSRDTPVSEIMSAPTVTAGLADSIGECMRAMTDHRVRYRRRLHRRPGELGDSPPGRRDPSSAGLHFGKLSGVTCRE
jgi:CBS domain-containing protein